MKTEPTRGQSPDEQCLQSGVDDTNCGSLCLSTQENVF